MIPPASFNEVYIAPGSFVATATQTFDLVSQGSGDNFMLKITQHITFLDGVVGSEVVRTETICQG